MAITNYLNLITSEHRSQPNFTAWLSAALQKVDDGMTMTNSIPSSFDVDSAVGVQLDVLGTIVGRGRVLNFQPADGSSPVLDDTHYRLAIKAKIAQNQWDGTTPQIYDIWNALFPNDTLQIVDNQNMTMKALIGGQLDLLSIEMLAQGYIIPKPQTVGLTIIGLSNANESPYLGMLVTSSDTITISTNHPS